VAFYILWEAYDRVRTPLPVRAPIIAMVAILGVIMNGAIATAMWRGRKDLNLRTVLIHNAGDAGANLAILVGALVMMRTGWTVIDPLLSVAIAVAVLWSAWGIIRETTHILLEGTPRTLHVEQVARAMLAVPGVAEVHDIHIWSLATDLHALSCHVRVGGETSTRESERILTQLNTLLAQQFNITHTTIQFEPLAQPDTRAYFPAQMRAKDS
jgi:cobalt-zinc-cadmium efflux system protein